MKKLGAASALLSSMRELRTDELRKEAELAPNLVVAAPRTIDAEVVAATVTGLSATPYVHLAAIGDKIPDLDLAEAVLIFDPDRGDVTRTFAATISSANPKCAVTWWHGDSPSSETAAAKARADILEHIPERATSFGRYFPSFRSEAVRVVIDDSAKRNAKFALVANVPTLLPFFGSLASATADLIVITRNQALLVFKIAAIHGRDLTDHIGIYKEMAPVVGAGLFWRSLAREAVAFIPFAGGTIPKVAIAYSGTVAVGQGADFYYRSGRKPSTGQLQRYFRQGMVALKQDVLPEISKRLGSKDYEVDYKVLEEEIN